jgi:hypothetical protein
VTNHGTISHPNTKHLLTTGNLYGHIENVWGIPFPKRIEKKDGVLGE